MSFVFADEDAESGIEVLICEHGWGQPDYYRIIWNFGIMLR